MSHSSGASGFWGWFAFGGSNGSAAVGTTGNTADCQVESYFFTKTVGAPLNPFLFTVDATGWVIGTESSGVPPGVRSFFITSGTFAVSGPGALILHQLFGVPVEVPFATSLATTAAALAGTPCNSGVAAFPGHVGFTGPGFEIQIQVTKVS